jgi:hypothetical protein
MCCNMVAKSGAMSGWYTIWWEVALMSSSYSSRSWSDCAGGLPHALVYARSRSCCPCPIEDRVSWIANDPRLLFLHDQAQERNHDAGDKVQERVRDA